MNEAVEHDLSRLFPPGVECVVATPQMWTSELYPEEEALIKQAIPARIREFTAGRACARQALARYGVDRFPLMQGSAGEPLWPEGLTGSITHTKTFCAAVVTDTSNCLSLGIDAEPAEPLPRIAEKDLLTENEQADIERFGNVRGIPWKRLYFSAKESAYKCMYPLLGEPFDFRHIEIELNPSRSEFIAGINMIKSLGLSTVPPIHGRFHSSISLLVTSTFCKSR